MDQNSTRISPEVVSRAVECPKSHACLFDPEFSSCEFTCVLGGRFCCLKQPCELECSYCISLDRQYFCDCPVKKEFCKEHLA